ncbi:hypothetical protein SRM1_01469 [Pseudomonas fluorescens]|nr:hypothetical protein SRM1_01469 [Pseudomonas fluorescens]
MYRAAQTAKRTGDGEGHQQAEQSQYHQRNAQSTQWPEQAFAVPGVEFGVWDAVDEQVGVTGFFTGELIGQAPPRQASVIVVLAGFEGSGTTGEGAAHDRVTAFVQHLNIDVVLAFALLEDLLSGFLALCFVALRPLSREGVETRMATEDPRVLIEHVPQQNGQPCNQSDGQPEACENTPEQ